MFSCLVKTWNIWTFIGMQLLCWSECATGPYLGLCFFFSFKKIQTVWCESHIILSLLCLEGEISPSTWKFWGFFNFVPTSFLGVFIDLSSLKICLCYKFQILLEDFSFGLTKQVHQKDLQYMSGVVSCMLRRILLVFQVEAAKVLIHFLVPAQNCAINLATLANCPKITDFFQLKWAPCTKS